MWKMSSCEVQGRGHLKALIPCQDKTKTSCKNNTFVISLSDGAGSARLSHYGAECVVNSITELLTSSFDSIYSEEDGRKVKLQIIETLLCDLQKIANSLSCSLKELAATLLVVAVKDERFIIAHIGDGVIGYLDDVGLKIASAPNNGEHANETYFVTSSDAVSVMKLFKGNCSNKSSFVLMSDGTEQSLYNKQQNSLSRAVFKLMQRNALIDSEVMNFQLQETFRSLISANTTDDCSIAILSRESGLIRSMNNLSFSEKCAVYHISTKDKLCRKRVERYDMILEFANTPASCNTIAKYIHLCPKHTKKQLKKMVEYGLLQTKNGLYHT